MPTCARCGDRCEKTPDIESTYDYCDSCWNLFDEIKENGVFIDSNITPGCTPRETIYYSDFGRWDNQVDALAAAKTKMEKHGCRGVFFYRGSKSYWLIDEYLEAHPNIAESVQKKLSSVVNRVKSLFA